MNDTTLNEAQVTEAPATNVFALLHAAHSLEDRVERQLGSVGLSVPKYSVLTELVNSGRPLSLSDLATRLSCVKSNMTQLIDRLEAEGLVKRVDDPADRRSVKASVTDQGREKQAAGAKQIEQLNARLAESLGITNYTVLERLLGALG